MTSANQPVSLKHKMYMREIWNPFQQNMLTHHLPNLSFVKEHYLKKKSNQHVCLGLLVFIKVSAETKRTLWWDIQTQMQLYKLRIESNRGFSSILPRSNFNMDNGRLSIKQNFHKTFTSLHNDSSFRPSRDLKLLASKQCRPDWESHITKWRLTCVSRK